MSCEMINVGQEEKGYNFNDFWFLVNRVSDNREDLMIWWMINEDDGWEASRDLWVCFH